MEAVLARLEEVLAARELAAELVLPYDWSAKWFELWTVRGEPEPRASDLGDEPPTDLDAAYHVRKGGPVVMTWAELLQHLPV